MIKNLCPSKVALERGVHAASHSNFKALPNSQPLKRRTDLGLMRLVRELQI
jgi:hypothetical protein